MVSGKTSWRVVGIFDAGGSVAESELWCDPSVLQGAYQRGNSYQSVYLRLESADSLQKLKDALAEGACWVTLEEFFHSSSRTAVHSAFKRVMFSDDSRIRCRSEHQ